VYRTVIPCGHRESRNHPFLTRLRDSARFKLERRYASNSVATPYSILGFLAAFHATYDPQGAIMRLEKANGCFMKKLRAGIVGSGFGNLVHAPAFKVHPGFDLLAVASPNRAEEVAKKHGLPYAFRSVEEMLAGVELDLITVASPPFDHHHSVLAAIAAGKHVLCEKPLGLSTAQAEEMLDASERAGVVGALCFEFRYVPVIAALKAMCHERHLGNLHEIEVTRLSSELLTRNQRRSRGWWFDRSKGGGVASAIMPHAFDLANHLSGSDPIRTRGLVRTANPIRTDADGGFQSTVADGAFAYVDYGNGLVARCGNDSTTVIDSVQTAAHGEGQSAVANGTWFTDLTLTIVSDERPHEHAVQPSPYDAYGSEIPNISLFLSLLDALQQKIRQGIAGVPSFADGLVVQRQLAAIGYPTDG